MQIAPSTAESIKPLLRPDQAAALKKDIEVAESKLTNPGIEDKQEVFKQIRNLRANYNEQVPKAPANAEEEGRLAARSAELLEHIIGDGMLSMAEMRAAPPGAPDGHLRWEKRNKAHILEWKNIQLRLRPGEREAANLERHRPTVGRMNLDTAVVERKQFYNIDLVAGPTVTLSEAELVALGAIAPEIHASVGSLTNEERAVVKRMVAGMIVKAEPAQKEAKKH